MTYSRSLLLYQHEPAHGLFFKLIIMVAPALLLFESLRLWSAGDRSDAWILLFESFFIFLLFWLIFPRKYQVYDDHLRIVLGSPFSVKVGFNQIKTIAATDRLSFGINFATALTKRHVEIVKSKGWRIAITPKDNDLFVERANQALNQWKDKKRHEI